MDELADLDIALDRIEEANDLRRPIALHAATENVAYNTSISGSKVEVTRRL